MSDNNWVKSILDAGEAGIWSTYLKRNVYILLGITAFDVTSYHLFNLIFHPTHFQAVVLFVASYVIPLVINFINFVWHRYPSLRIPFSAKTNIVFAYNLKGINEDKFIKKYNSLVEQVRNEIDSQGLGKRIEVIVARSDIRFKEPSAAEAKVLLGLQGSVLLVWGYVISNNGQIKFNTKFSYEFAYPQKIAVNEAKKNINLYLERVMERGLFSSLKTNISTFRDQITPTLYFILGLTTFSMKFFEKSENFFLAFKDYYKKSDIMRKRDLGPTYAECNEMLFAMYLDQIPYLSVESKEESINKSEELVCKMLGIKPKDYLANLTLAYIFDLRGNHDMAVSQTEIAGSVAPKKFHEHLFNRAYFELHNTNYSLALQVYESIPDESSVVATEVARYLSEKYSKTKDPAFMFADAYVSIRWGDKVTGKKSLKKFLKIANPVSHAIFLQKSAEILEMSTN